MAAHDPGHHVQVAVEEPWQVGLYLFLLVPV